MEGQWVPLSKFRGRGSEQVRFEAVVFPCVNQESRLKERGGVLSGETKPLLCPPVSVSCEAGRPRPRSGVSLKGSLPIVALGPRPGHLSPPAVPTEMSKSSSGRPGVHACPKDQRSGGAKST